MAELPRDDEFNSKHPHFLSFHIGEELDAIRRPQRASETGRQFSRIYRAHQDRIRQLITEHLTRLDELLGEPETDPIQVYVARAELRMRLARLNGIAWTAEEVETKERLLLQALKDAGSSCQKRVVFSVHMELGHLYRYAESFESAEWHYKEALAFVHSRWNDVWTTEVLYWLGTLYSEYVETLPMAVYIFDWRSRFVPHGFTSFEEKQKCRLALGERVELLAELQLEANASPREIANAIGAAEALGRRKPKIIALAQRGIAVTPQGSWWRSHFEGVLERATRVRGAPAERTGEAPAVS